MFCIIEDEFVDWNLDILSELLSMLDGKISEINSQILNSSDPDYEGLCNTGEYFIGIGFVAIQRYLVDTLIGTGIDKNKAYILGPKFSSDITYVSLINSAANWWKHEAEWFNKDEIPRNGQRTIEHVTAIAESHEYALSNILASICGSGNISLGALVPYLIEWRNFVHNERVREKSLKKNRSAINRSQGEVIAHKGSGSSPLWLLNDDCRH